MGDVLYSFLISAICFEARPNKRRCHCFMSALASAGAVPGFLKWGGTHDKRVCSGRQGGWELMRCVLNMFALGGGERGQRPPRTPDRCRPWASRCQMVPLMATSSK